MIKIQIRYAYPRNHAVRVTRLSGRRLATTPCAADDDHLQEARHYLVRIPRDVK